MTQMGETKPVGGFRAESLLKVLEETNVSSFPDAWGPTNVMQVYDPETSMQGLLVIDNTSLGPGCGGIRISPTITPREVFQRARTVTMICALAEIEFGGAAAGIRAVSPDTNRIQLVKAFARGISPHVPEQYVACPDLNTGQVEMRAFVDEIGDRQGAAGKPVDMGGIPFELGVIGFGIGVAVEESLAAYKPSKVLPPSLAEAKVAVQGFENTGSALTKYLANKGASIVAISDEWGTVTDPKGLEVNKLSKCASAPSEKQSLSHLKGMSKYPKEDIIKVDCDILLLCTDSNMLTEDTAPLLKARCVVEGNNNPISAIADQMLTKKGVHIIPDIIAAAGGPISAYAEFTRNSCERAFSHIEAKIKDVTRYLVGKSIELGVPLRRMAKETAKERILDAAEVLR
jgi:glutamate dehydrogenase (NAD(P)+)